MSKVGFQRNRIVVAAADGTPIGKEAKILPRRAALAPLAKEFKRLPAERRMPEISDNKNLLAKKKLAIPNGGLALQAHCTLLEHNKQGIAELSRAEVFYYPQNPNRWKFETQTDSFWLTEAERKSLIPAGDLKVGNETNVGENIQSRFFSTVGIDFNQGSIPSAKVRNSTMLLKIQRITDETVELRLEGYGQMGVPYDKSKLGQPRSRGYEIRLLGLMVYSKQDHEIERFDIVGVGEAWGKVRNEKKIFPGTWNYGIACELIPEGSPVNTVPPYNLLHYGAAGPYFQTDAK